MYVWLETQAILMDGNIGCTYVWGHKVGNGLY